MPSLTLDNVSDELYDLLQRQADVNRSTVGAEAVFALVRGVREPGPHDEAPPTLEEIRAFRETLTCAPLTMDAIQAAIGRRSP
jgi:hypothetical protein